MNWFQQLTGFTEESPDQVRQNLTPDGAYITSKINQRKMRCGTLEITSLEQLRKRVEVCENRGKIRLKEVVADVQQLHCDPQNSGALFQVASQFNLLEMASPDITPEQGIGIYQYDRTQGPACAIACGAGTLYRNYFVELNGARGQRKTCQINTLKYLLKHFRVQPVLKNGYYLPPWHELMKITTVLTGITEKRKTRLTGLLQVGLQHNTEVTLNSCGHTVSQIYCSALPVGYSEHPEKLWEPFAKLILSAAYEATICAAILNGSNKLFLTLLGGGVFGNQMSWIIDVIKESVIKYRHYDLDIAIVSYGASNGAVRGLVEEMR